MGAADHMAATTGSRTAAEFLNNVVRPMLSMEGDKLPVRCGEALGRSGGGWGSMWPACCVVHCWSESREQQIAGSPLARTSLQAFFCIF